MTVALEDQWCQTSPLVRLRGNKRGDHVVGGQRRMNSYHGHCVPKNAQGELPMADVDLRLRTRGPCSKGMRHQCKRTPGKLEGRQVGWGRKGCKREREVGGEKDIEPCGAVCTFCTVPFNGCVHMSQAFATPLHYRMMICSLFGCRSIFLSSGSRRSDSAFATDVAAMGGTIAPCLMRRTVADGSTQFCEAEPATAVGPGEYYLQGSAQCMRAWNKAAHGHPPEVWRGAYCSKMDCGEDSFVLTPRVLAIADGVGMLFCSCPFTKGLRVLGV